MKRSLVTLSLFALGAASFAQTFQFQVTIENLGPQPLSPLFWSAGNSSFDIFQLGGTSSAGIKAIAEGGNTAPMMGIAGAAGADVFSFGTLPGGPLGPGGSNSGLFSTDNAHPFFSFAMMLGKTNDGFLGESFSTSNLSLFNQGTPEGFSMTITGLRAWDAGTEMNTQNAADLGFLGGSGNPADANTAIRIHDSVTPGVGDSWAQMPDWDRGTPLARVT
ncbi:MAG: spondin domain-containing protein, partial [Chthonomonadaceae bacterium]|nr:spondin domain-containing protein [Chthonomonadaceae bacterium]